MASVLLLACLFITSPSLAQTSILKKPISVRQTNISLGEVLRLLGDQAGVTFSYSSTLINPQKTVNLAYVKTPLEMILADILGEVAKGVQVENNGSGIPQIVIKPVRKTGSVEGTVTTSDGKPAEFVNIRIDGLGKGSQTDINGQYFIGNVPLGTYNIRVSRIGFQAVVRTVDVQSTNVFSQDFTLNASSNELGEVIVTASRVAESINEVPSSITYIKKADVEIQSQINNNLPNILMQKVPSLSPSEESQNNFIAKLRGRNFLVLIDGVPQSTPLRSGGRDLRSIDASAIDHIEVINGASSMYGNGAAGGIINYITRKPAKDKPFSSTTYINNSLNLAKVGDTHGYSIAQLFSGSFKKLDYVLQGKLARTGVIRSADGTIVSPFYGLGETDSYNTMAKIGYTLIKEHRLEVMGNYYQSIQDSKYVGTTAQFGVSPATGVLSDTVIHGGTPYNKTLSLKYVGRFGKTEANISLYYDDMKTVFETYNQIYSDHTGARINFTTPTEFSSKRRLLLIYGLDLLKDHTVQTSLTNALVTPDMNMNSLAPYLQAKLNLIDFWIFKGGMRFENIGFQVSDLTRSNGITTPGAKNRYHALVFNAGVRYNRLAYLQPFASFSQGFSIGDVGLVLRNGIPLNAIDAKPILVNNYELGFSGTQNAINYQLVGYYSFSKTGTTFAEVNGVGNYELIQVPQKIYGLEAVIDVKATKWLKLGGTLGYMDGRQDNKNNGDFSGKLDNSVVSPIKINGNMSVNITDNWNLMLQMIHIGSRDVFPLAEYNYGKYPVTGYNLVDLYTSYKLNKFSVNLSVNNLFNANYFPLHSEVRGATNGGRYYVKGSGALATLGIVVKL